MPELQSPLESFRSVRLLRRCRPLVQHLSPHSFSPEIRGLAHARSKLDLRLPAPTRT